MEGFLERDVKLRFSQMADNPDLRSLAKLMLNSFCCKFEQRENQSKRITIKKLQYFLA